MKIFSGILKKGLLAIFLLSLGVKISIPISNADLLAPDPTQPTNPEIAVPLNQQDETQPQLAEPEPQQDEPSESEPEPVESSFGCKKKETEKPVKDSVKTCLEGDSGSFCSETIGYWNKGGSSNSEDWTLVHSHPYDVVITSGSTTHHTEDQNGETLSVTVTNRHESKNRYTHPLINGIHQMQIEFISSKDEWHTTKNYDNGILAYQKDAVATKTKTTEDYEERLMEFKKDQALQAEPKLESEIKWKVENGEYVEHRIKTIVTDVTIEDYNRYVDPLTGQSMTVWGGQKRRIRSESSQNFITGYKSYQTDEEIVALGTHLVDGIVEYRLKQQDISSFSGEGLLIAKQGYREETGSLSDHIESVIGKQILTDNFYISSSYNNDHIDYYGEGYFKDSQDFTFAIARGLEGLESISKQIEIEKSWQTRNDIRYSGFDLRKENEYTVYRYQKISRDGEEAISVSELVNQVYKETRFDFEKGTFHGEEITRQWIRPRRDFRIGEQYLVHFLKKSEERIGDIQTQLIEIDESYWLETGNKQLDITKIFIGSIGTRHSFSYLADGELDSEIKCRFEKKEDGTWVQVSCEQLYPEPLPEPPVNA